MKINIPDHEAMRSSEQQQPIPRYCMSCEYKEIFDGKYLCSYPHLSNSLSLEGVERVLFPDWCPCFQKKGIQQIKKELSDSEFLRELAKFHEKERLITIADDIDKINKMFDLILHEFCRQGRDCPNVMNGWRPPQTCKGCDENSILDCWKLFLTEIADGKSLDFGDIPNKNGKGKTKVLFVTGDDDYGALSFEQNFTTEEVATSLVPNGESKVWECDSYQFEAQLFEIDSIPEEFISFLRRYILNYDDSKHKNFYIVE